MVDIHTGRFRKRLKFCLFSIFTLLLLSVTVLATTHAPIPDNDFFVAPPPFSEGIYPCSDCHAGMEANTTRRELTFHEDIKLKNHAEDQRWCLDCHNPDDRDKLRLASGKLIPFEKSYYLCGQCHGTIFRDWKIGVHGRRIGEWNGKKEYLLCAHCHNPHSPRFRSLKPLPPPAKPLHSEGLKTKIIKFGEQEVSVPITEGTKKDEGH